jgi:hypothetical protein
MKKNILNLNDDELRPEYDFSTMKDGIRGKYVDRLRKASNVVLLEPEVAQAFPNSEAVNQALKEILKTTRLHRRTGKAANRAPRKRK